jgi:predicted nuclease of restriction endonuclease-like (RecB) superfamily
MERTINNFENLALAIQESNDTFLQQAQKQVNVAFTLRNWVIGHHIFEYEQSGVDRAQYGEQVLKKLAEQLKKIGLKGLSSSNLYHFKQFYLAYPQIVKALPEQFQLPDNQTDGILQTLSVKFKGLPVPPATELIGKLSYSHFIELMRFESPLKRTFYETETIKSNWSVRELQRAINSMLYERTGLSTDKKSVLESFNNKASLIPENIFRSPYILEFLCLEEKPAYTETQVEQAIIDHLQQFLLELGRGFCFEARQKRITFDNTHYRIDLVFYHRILKCHVLLDLKLGDFTPADAGQMNLYINYYKDIEMHENDNPPIGIILCAGKNETLVKYATAGMSENLFVSKYLHNLPTENELKQIIQEEQSKNSIINVNCSNSRPVP